jgi:hypothetical protein
MNLGLSIVTIKVFFFALCAFLELEHGRGQGQQIGGSLIHNSVESSPIKQTGPRIGSRMR